MQDLVSVAEAAGQLGLSPRRIRALIESEVLPAERVGRQWLIAAYALADFQGRAAGRPMAADVAWACLAELARQHVDWISGSHAARLRKRMLEQLRGASASWRLRSWCANRAESLRLRVFQPALDGLREDPRLVLGGVSVAASFHESAALEGYISGSCRDALTREHGLPSRNASAERKPNLLLRVVDDVSVVPRDPHDPHQVAEIVAAVDLLDSGEPRAVQEAQSIVERVVQQWRSGRGVAE